MSAFEQLHPAIQHHVVNSLGWRELRPLQEHAIEPVLTGRNCLLLAPTAGGKTEAAIFPVLSRMLSEDWQGLSVLYVCPIRALLNNLEHRLSHYAGLVGRSCGLWHGDVAQASKSRTLGNPPDILLTTPESLEALLVSQRTDRFFFFGNVKAIVVDEIHAFAGDDRGWHLLAVLERLRHITQQDTQRIGLSATVGNPERLLHWLTGTSSRESVVVAPDAGPALEAEIAIDFVGNLRNAAQVLKTLHRGEKRLVFCDSRARTEELASHLRGHGVATFVSHSSLAVDQRRDAEQAFRESRDCVIVATSTLELGIDVGDLDRVIQLDSPRTVASFLQRLGRTGRRSGTRRNCLFLTTSRDTLLQASALALLWREGYVEPVEPPQRPLHLIPQQIMALILQQRGIGRGEWKDWLVPLLPSMHITEAEVEAIVDHMLENQILVRDGAILGMGPRGERLYGGRNYMDLLSIFDTPPVFTVFHGPRDLGTVHPISFIRPPGQPAILSLGGRAWLVTGLDVTHQIAHVVPSEDFGRSRWLGEGRPLSYAMCQAMRRILLGVDLPEFWSRRAAAEIAQALEETRFASPEALVIELDEKRDRTRWWTFAGLYANFQLAASVSSLGTRCDNLSISRTPVIGPADFEKQIHQAGTEAFDARIAESEPPKFHECLPDDLFLNMSRLRLSDPAAVEKTLAQKRLYRDAE